MDSWSVTLPLAAGAYLAGSIPFGLLIARLARGIDIRRHGSGNIGTANVLRTAGRGPAAATLLADALKGLLPVLAGRALDLPLYALLLIALAGIIGHNWSLFLRGKGGKGIATSLGATLALAPLAALIGLGVWAVVIVASRYASLASLMMIASLPLALALMGYPQVYWLFGLALLALALYRHRANIARLIGGTELKISIGFGGYAD